MLGGGDDKSGVVHVVDNLVAVLVLDGLAVLHPTDLGIGAHVLALEDDAGASLALDILELAGNGRGIN